MSQTATKVHEAVERIRISGEAAVARLDDLPLHVTRATDCDGDRWHRSPHNPARWALEGSDDWWVSSTASDEYGPFIPVGG